MSSRRGVRLAALGVVVLLAGWLAGYAKERGPDVVYVPTPTEVVAEMLQTAKVGRGDIVYDLGCGDGRIVITAIEKFRAKKGVGIDIDPERIKECHENARKSTVGERVTFLRQDLFDTDFSEATVVTLYLLPELNHRLRPTLLRQLRPGDRIVSHAFDMKEWQADKTIDVTGPDGGGTVYYWIVPGGAAGTWQWTLPKTEGEEEFRLHLRQRFQTVSGSVEVDGKRLPIVDATLTGDRLGFGFARETDGKNVKMTFAGRIIGDALSGTVENQGGSATGKRDWTANRARPDLVGAWQWTLNEKPAVLRIESRDGRRYGALLIDKRRQPVSQFYVWGAGVYFLVGGDVDQTFEGVVEGERIVGTVTGNGGTAQEWTAQRSPKGGGRSAGAKPEKT